MGPYIIRRLLLMIPTMFGITVVTFFLIRLAPGDPVSYKLGSGAAAGPSIAAGSSQENQNRETQILKAKERLGLMRERGTLRTWGASSAKGLEEIPAHDKSVRAIAYGPEGTFLATAAADGTIVLRDARSNRELSVTQASPRAINAMDVSLDGAFLVAAGDDRVVWLFRVERGGVQLEEVARLEGHERIVTSIAFHPDGNLVASGSRDRTVRLWEIPSGRELASLGEHALEVLDLDFSPDGRYLVSAGLDRKVVIRPVSASGASDDGLIELTDYSAAVRAIAFSPDSASFVAALANGSIVLRGGSDWAPMATLTGHTGQVNAIDYHPQGERLVSASHDGSVRIWDLAEKKEVALGAGHSSHVLTVAYRPDGEEFASGGLDLQDVPIFTAYFDWLWKLARFDFGLSFKDSRPVKDRLLEAVPITLKLNLISILIAYLISIPIGVFAAARRDGVFDHCSSFVVFLLYSMPNFWVGTMLILLVGSAQGFTAQYFEFTLPFTNVHDDNAHNFTYLDYVVDHWKHLILPLAAITYSSFAFLSRLVRSGMLEVLNQDYVRTARAKGLREMQVVGVHAFRNSLISVITVFANILPALIGGSVIIESIFSIPGMGLMGFEAILQRDYPVIMAVTTLAAVLTLLGILLSDILYCLVDPRIQLR